MDPGPAAPGGGGRDQEGDPSQPPLPAAAAATASAPPPAQQQQQPTRYESQKRRDWNTFLQYLRNHRPPLSLSKCSGVHVIEFLKYLDQFGKTKVHAAGCSYFGQPNPPAPCACPLRQAWGSLDALIGRLRAAYEENDGRPESNPFGARAVGIYLREVKESQAKARGIPYEKKRKRKRPLDAATRSGGGVTGEGSSGGGMEAALSTAAAASSTVSASSSTVAGAYSSSAAGEGSLAPPAGSSSA